MEQALTPPVRTWVLGASPGAKWHLAWRFKSAFSQTVHFRTVCTGKSLYSVWGVTTWEGTRPKELENAVCKRCDAILARGA